MCGNLVIMVRIPIERRYASSDSATGLGRNREILLSSTA